MLIDGKFHKYPTTDSISPNTVYVDNMDKKFKSFLSELSDITNKNIEELINELKEYSKVLPDLYIKNIGSIPAYKCSKRSKRIVLNRL